jgi:hypothetical protein
MDTSFKSTTVSAALRAALGANVGALDTSTAVDDGSVVTDDIGKPVKSAGGGRPPL